MATVRGPPFGLDEEILDQDTWSAFSSVGNGIPARGCVVADLKMCSVLA